MPRPISDLFKFRGGGKPDYRFAGPTHECLCGSGLFLILASFHEHQIGVYFTDMVCADCGALLTAPTEADIP